MRERRLEAARRERLDRLARDRRRMRPAGQAEVMERLWTAFPDARFEIEVLAEDGDTVVCIGTMSGTHEGELFGIPGSGKPIAWRQCHIMTVTGGKATAHRAIRDDLGLMRQMGVVRPSG